MQESALRRVPDRMNRTVERRKRPRLPLRLRAIIRQRGGSEQFEAQTENMNCEGICFRSAASFALGECLDITLELEDFLGPSHRYSSLVCHGRVVQAESDDPAAPFHYGCEILDYALQPADVADSGELGSDFGAMAVR